MSSWDNDDKTCYETALEIIDRAAHYIESHDKGEATFGGPKYKRCRRRDTTKAADRDHSVPARPGFGTSVSSARSRTTKRCCGFVNSVDGRGWRNSARRARTISCAPRSSRSSSTGIRRPAISTPEDGDRRRARPVPQGLRGLLRTCKRPDSPAMRDPNPTVVLIPGLGMIAWGKNKSESRVTAEFYNCAIEVMRGAEAIDQYEAMDQQEAFDIEYWPLEEAKLQRMPPEKELDRQIVVVIGAGAGIGKATAHRLVKEGAHVVCVDRDEAAAKATAEEIIAKYGAGIGVAGTGISATAAPRSALAATSPIASAVADVRRT